MLAIELKELLHNLKDRDWDINPVYKMDENEADKVIKQLERLDKIFVNADEIEPDDEIFKDDYSDKNTQNGWIYCKDRLPKTNGKVLAVHKSAELGYEVCITTYLGFWFSSDVIAWQPLPKWEVEEC